MTNQKGNRKKCMLLAAALVIIFQAHTQPVPLDPLVRTGKLANGFTYFIRHNEEPKQRVIMYLVNKVGALQEEDHQRGLAHFLEHMCFNGTKHYPKHQLVEYLQKTGVRFGADLNAYTSFEETVYQLPLPADDSSIVSNGLQILRDWAGDISLDPDEIDSERGVILEEKRMRYGPGERLQEKYFPLQVNRSRFASRLPIGTDEVLNTFTPDHIGQFYKDWYRPNQQSLIIVGDIDVNTIEQHIKRLFGDLENPVQERPVVRYTIPLTGKNNFLTATDPELTATEINILIKHKGVPLRTKADFRTHIVRTLFNQVLSDRLGELSVRQDPPFIQSQASHAAFMGGLDAFNITIVPKPGKIKDAFQQVWTELVRLQRMGVTKTEFERAKLAYINGMENIYREKKNIPSDAYVQDYLAWFLHGTAAPGIEAEYALVKELMNDVIEKDVNLFARASLKSVDRDIALFTPEKNRAELPTEREVNEWIKMTGSKPLAVWKDNIAENRLLTSLPTPGKVIQRERMDTIDVTVYTLSNGARVWVKPTTFKQDEVLFGAVSEGGTSLYPDSLFLQAAAAGPFITANGLDRFSPVELNKMLTGKSVQAQMFVQDRYEGMNGSSTAKDVETALQLLNLYFTKPRYDSMLFNNNLQANKAILADRQNSPEVALNDLTGRILGGNHYRRQPPSVAKIDSLRLSKIFSIYKERFANAADFTFVFTGSIDTTVFIPLLEKYIGSLPSTATREMAKDPGIYVPDGQFSETIRKGNDNKAIVRLYYSGDYTFHFTNNTQLSALGSVLQYRMTQRIREVEGGAYTPRAGINSAKLPRSRYLAFIEFTCAPQNVESLIAAVKDEINKLKSAGASEDDVNKFKAEQVRLREMQLQTNGFWQSWLMYVLQNHEPTTGILKLKERLTAVTPQSVQRAAQQFLDEKNFIRLVLLPQE